MRTVGSWFGTFFWIIGAFSLFCAALGIVDYTARLVADVVKTSYAQRIKESSLYFAVVWLLVLIGCGITARRLRAAAGAAGDLGVRRRR